MLCSPVLPHINECVIAICYLVAFSIKPFAFVLLVANVVLKELDIEGLWLVEVCNFTLYVLCNFILDIKGYYVNSVNWRRNAAILIHLECSIPEGDIDEDLAPVPWDEFVNYKEVVFSTWLRAGTDHCVVEST